MPHKNGGAQRASGIAGSRLNPDILKRPFAQQTAIGNAIEGDPAGEDEVLAVVGAVVEDAADEDAAGADGSVPDDGAGGPVEDPEPS